MSYVKYENGQVVELSCKGCEAVIGRMVPHDQPTTRRQGAQTFITERMVFAFMANYREVLLDMNDGHKHVTCMCADCAARTDLDWTAIYEADVAQWVAETGLSRDKIEPLPLPGTLLNPAASDAVVETPLGKGVATVDVPVPALRAPVGVLRVGAFIQ